MAEVACHIPWPALGHHPLLGSKTEKSKGQPLFNEDRASRLCLLPWFSRGLIPRWIRLRLINALPQIRKKQATELILNLLSQAQEREPSPHEHLITLPVAISDARPGQKNKDGQRVDLAVAAGDALFIDLVSNSGGGSLIAPPEVLTRLGQGTHEQKRRHAWLDWAIALALPFYFGGLAYLSLFVSTPESSLTLYLERKGGEPIPAVDVIKAEGSLSVEGVHLRVSPKGLTADLPKVAFEKASSAEYLKELFRRYRVLDARTKSTRIVLVVEPLFVQANDVKIALLDPDEKPVQVCDLTLDIAAERRFGPGWAKLGQRERARGLKYSATNSLYTLNLPWIEPNELLISTAEPGNSGRLLNATRDAPWGSNYQLPWMRYAMAGSHGAFSSTHLSI